MNILPRIAVGWHAMLWLAAAYNLVVGLAGLVQGAGAPMEQTVSLLVACFGIVYAMVARHPLRFAPVLWAGVIGKIGVVAILARVAFGSQGDRLLAVILAGDIVFTLGFIAFLLGPGKFSRRHPLS